jgi:two-component system phosphate regulon sensor histidine kinase PhoR
LMFYRFPLTETRIDFINLETQGVLQRTNHQTGSTQQWLSTEVIPIDIFETIGIRAHAKVMSVAILERMSFQLVLSFLLVSFCIFFLSTIIRTFFWREKVEAMRQVSIDTMTHEFKRPISSAVAQVALIPYYLERGKPEKASKYAESTLLELNKLTAYTERIQSISKGTLSNLVLNENSVYLPDFFKRMEDKYAGGADEKGAELEIVFNSRLKYLRMDILHMSNVLDNLVENALKYSKSNPKIVVDVSDEKDWLLLRVNDDGIGITKTEVSKVFDRYFRSLKAQHHTTNGFGLGLTYCKLIVEAHGGTIAVESELGVGTVFSVRLPIH